VNYIVEMGSGALIYIYTKFHKDRFSHSNGNRDTHAYTHTCAGRGGERAQDEFISLL
jgi:hypothetical protein